MKEGLASRIRESLVSTPTRPEDLHDVESTESTRPSERVDTDNSDHEDDTTAADNNAEAEILTFRERMDRRVAESDEPDELEHAGKIAEVYKMSNRSDSEASRDAQKQVFGEVRYEPTENLAELAEAQADTQVSNRLDQSTPRSSRQSPSEHDRRTAATPPEALVSTTLTDSAIVNTTTDETTTGDSHSISAGQNDTDPDAPNEDSTPPDREGQVKDSDKSNQGDQCADSTDTTDNDRDGNDDSFWDK